MEQKPGEETQPDLIKEYWNKEAETYYRYIPGKRAELPAKFDEFYQSHMGELTNVLDIGCGPGKFLIPMLQDGLNVTGIDISEKMLVEAKKNLESAKDILKGKVHLKARESKNLSFAGNGSFDYVFAKGSIHHNNWAGIQQSFKEVARVLRPGKFFLFQVRSLADAALTHSEPILDVGTDGGITAKDVESKKGIIEHYFSKSELEKLARENGFQIVVEPEEIIRQKPKGVNARWWVVYKKIK